MKMPKIFTKLSLLVLTFVCISNSYTQSCPSGMISYWKLQELSGATFNDSYGNHDALAQSSPSQTSGISGKGQLFNNSSSTYISVPDHADFDWSKTSSFSIEFWVKFSEIGSIRVFIGRDDPATATQWYIGQTETGEIEWFTMDSNGNIGDLISTGTYNNGQWHHVVAVRDGSISKNYLYIDGVSQNTTVNLTGNLYSTSDLNIGCLVYNETPDYFFTGSLDEIAIYNRVLTSPEITTHYNNARLYQIGYCDGNMPVILSTPTIYATVGQQYSYDVDASGNTLPTYSLTEKPTDMVIDPVSGAITWTPGSATQNGHVVVKASNDKGFVEQSFNLFIATPPSCRDNLISYWDFNAAGSGPYFDNIDGYKLTGSGANHASGRVGSGLSFDGVDDSLNMIDFAEPASIFFDFDNIPSFSFEIWMKSSATPSATMVMIGRNQVGNGTQYWVGVNPDGTVGFYLSDYPEPPSTAYLEGGSVLDGSWHHIVATYNASTNDMKLYVDKNMVAETNQNFANFGAVSNLNIGYLDTPIDKFWYQGLIDEVAIYSVPLSDAQITINYNTGAAGNGACVYNFAPTILTTPDTLVNQGGAYYYKITSTDINYNDVLTISAISKPAWLNFTFVPGDSTAILSATPGNSDVGLHNITLRVSDGSINVDQTFKIRVVNINDVPIITSNPVSTTNEDALYSYTIEGNDIDAGTTLVYSAPVKPEWLSLNPITHILSGTPTNDNVGISNITVSISDGIVSVDQSFQLTVNNVNDKPVFTTSPVLEVDVNKVYMYTCKASDVDAGDVLTISAESKPEWLTFTPGSDNAVLMGIPTLADVGSHAIILKVNDGYADVLQGFSINVKSVTDITNIDNSIINSVYPNPANEVVNFKFTGISAITRIEIYNTTGSLVKEVKGDNQDILKIDISDLSSGIYLYKAYFNDKMSIGKISRK
jgi:hypothetical protein